MSSPRILILRHIPVEGPAALSPLMQARGFQARILDVDSKTAWPGLESFEAMIILGGPQSVYAKGRWPEMAVEQDLVAAAHKAGKPMLGICLGAQMLAQALGGRAYFNPRGKELGWAEVTLSPGAGQSGPLAGLPQSFPALHWHGDTFDLPPGSQHLASSALTPNQGFVLGKSWALQFHLEVEAEDIRAWVAEYQDEAGQHLKGDPEADLARFYPQFKAVREKVFNRFLDLV
jgi:GMP synthase (glutamine-hydrolysing)